MTTPYDLPPDDSGPSGWATGGLVFAGAALVLAGIFQAFSGIAAIADDQFFVKTHNYAFKIDITAWGWIHLIIGVLVFVVGLGLFSRAGWAAVGAIAVAMLSAVSNFFFIPDYPIWAVLIIALDVWVIWALTRPGIVQD